MRPRYPHRRTLFWAARPSAVSPRLFDRARAASNGAATARSIPNNQTPYLSHRNLSLRTSSQKAKRGHSENRARELARELNSVSSNACR